MQENTEEKRRALDRAFRSLAARAHTENEIVEKLTRAGYSEEAIAGAMETLTRYRLVDDAAYAESWVSARAKRGIGPYRLQQELRRKGVSREDAQAALDTLDADDSLDAAASFAAKRLKNDSPDEKRRAMQALLRRGYSFETARAALERALGGALEEE